MLPALLASWAPRLIAGIALFAFGCLAGARVVSNEAARDALRAERAKAVELQRLSESNARMAADLAFEKAREKVVYREIVRQVRVPHVVREIIEVPVAGGEPVCTVSRGYVGVWNDALFGRLPAAASGIAGAAGVADAAGESSGLRPGALLENHVDNAERCRSIERQLDRLIDWHETH